MPKKFSIIKLNGKVKYIFSILITLATMHACDQSKNTQEDSGGMPSQAEVNRNMEAYNRQMMLEESAVIDGYVERRNWNVTKTGTGLRYVVYEPGPDGPLIQEGEIVEVDYEVSLFDGEVVYSSKESGPRSFLVGQDNVESGIHEAVTYLKVGDRAKVILPSHLAHGLTGDNDKIPPRSTVIYDLHVLRKK